MPKTQGQAGTAPDEESSEDEIRCRYAQARREAATETFEDRVIALLTEIRDAMVEKETIVVTFGSAE